MVDITQGKPHGIQIISDDLRRNGKCRLSFAKETFDNGYNAWALPKKSRFLDVINKGFV